MDINYQKIIREDLGDYISSFYLAIKHEFSIQDIYTYSNTFLAKRKEILHSIIITKEKMSSYAQRNGWGTLSLCALP